MQFSPNLFHFFSSVSECGLVTCHVIVSDLYVGLQNNNVNQKQYYVSYLHSIK